VIRKFALVLAAGALLASPAAARRPTAGERASLTATVHAYITMTNSPAAHDNRITTIAVSSIDSRYAAVHVTSPTVGSALMVLHRSRSAWWVLEFGSSLGCDIGPAAVLRELNVGCEPPGATAWINDCGPLVSAPAQLILACGDGNYLLTHLRWRNWGRSVATASGTVRANDCKPYCAAGHFHSYAATVAVDHLARCNSAHYYARLTITYANTRPGAIAKRDVHALGC
jgi:hypothetical protein